MSKQNKPTLLVAKGDMSRLGGAERDLIRRLPHLTTYFDVKLATLHTSEELVNLCHQNSIEIFTPKIPWKIPTGALANMRDMIHKTSQLAWKSCDGLQEFIGNCDYFHIVSGDGYLAIIEMIPRNSPCHLYLHEPHRGLHEDSLHRNLNGRLKRPKIITDLLLRQSRNRDLTIVREFYNRKHTTITGNSNYSSSRADEVYGIKTEMLHPCIDVNEYSSNKSVDNPSTFKSEYVVTVGTANWAKGTMEVIDMLNGTNISLAHVGGGTKMQLEKINQHAKNKSVDIWIAPKLSSEELCQLIENSLAVVSMAHKEPFGLTPIEAFSIGTPAIFVDEGGFRDTIIDGICGRLLGRNDYSEWHNALQQCRNNEIREEWSRAGKKRIIELELSPKQQAEKIYKLLLQAGGTGG